jgi:hypothetical protein
MPLVVLGESLNRYLFAPERRRFFHPEMQAELEFGLEQSKSASVADTVENLRHFFAQDSDWDAADREIVALRAGLQQTSLPAAAELAAAGLSQSGLTNSTPVARDAARPSCICVIPSSLRPCLTTAQPRKAVEQRLVPSRGPSRQLPALVELPDAVKPEERLTCLSRLPIAPRLLFTIISAQSVARMCDETRSKLK